MAVKRISTLKDRVNANRRQWMRAKSRGERSLMQAVNHLSIGPIGPKHAVYVDDARAQLSASELKRSQKLRKVAAVFSPSGWKKLARAKKMIPFTKFGVARRRLIETFISAANDFSIEIERHKAGDHRTCHNTSNLAEAEERLKNAQKNLRILGWKGNISGSYWMSKEEKARIAASGEILPLTKERMKAILDSDMLALETVNPIFYPRAPRIMLHESDLAALRQYVRK